MTETEIFQALETTLPTFLDAECNGRRDICVLATRLTIEAACYFGIPCQPVVTLVNAANARYFELSGELGRWPSLEEIRASGAHSVGCDGITCPQGRVAWPFHLIARSGFTAFDPTCGQLSRPERGIIVPRTLTFDLAPNASPWFVPLAAGGGLYYTPAGSNAYLRAPDWNPPKRVGGRLIRLLRQKGIR